MDIFTTVLTRVVPVSIKPERLRVKALVKEPDTHELSDDLDHLEEHEKYFIDEKPQDSKENNSKKQQPLIEEEVAVITDKEDFIHPKKTKKITDDDVKHLDIFV